MSQNIVGITSKAPIQEWLLADTAVAKRDRSFLSILKILTINKAFMQNHSEPRFPDLWWNGIMNEYSHSPYKIKELLEINRYNKHPAVHCC
jgi:hypothetical protein